MEGNKLKQRLVGATVLVVLAIILIPMLLTGGKEDDSSVATIPPKLDTGFSSRITPLEPAPAPPKPAVIDSTPLPVPAPSTDNSAAPAGVSPQTSEKAPGAIATAPSADKTDTQSAAKSGPPKPDTPPQSDKPVTDEQVADKSPTDKPEADKPAPSKPLASAAPAATAPSKERMNITAWIIQLGSFSSEQNALALRDQLRAKGYTAFVEKIKSGDSQLFRVRVGPELERARADALRDKLEKETKQKGIVERYPS
ncbi:MAG: SPOR domain-containing protein [Gammaproteobacteria bacterium]|nr:SPOR domain-containing protein [Gammaproteobacteria bacterium]